LAAVTLDFLARQMERMLSEQAASRDDMTVLLGRINHVERIVSRRLDNLDDTLKRVLTELEVLRSQTARASERVRRLELREEEPRP
jgi:hypothetical protein